ncbi:ABC transporter substrate-binding protein [Pseudomonas aeruginosa]|uniref:substrate-binding periplasmic protein n=1 Tax=Pseudomonas aeruginosa TaxID=287 RepID=UPI000F618EDF|nr:transporter substrate-binding domain-containing protein [Pseudomonas aeruginosa]RRI52109.1 ABC transporter substrate-binding protein [Pseudomonas aeruginosa]
MRLLVLFCCLWLLPGVASAAPSVGEIRVVSETWTRYTQEDGRGVAWNLLRAVYEPAGVRLRIANEPYTRAVGLVLRGEADAWVGAYRGEIDEALYPRWPYDVDPIAVLSLKDNPPPPLEGLSRFRLSWMRGYAFARYFPTLTPHSELQRRTSALPMLLNHRVDYFIDSRPELEEMLAGAGALAAEYRITDVTRLPLYLGFSDSPRGRELLALFDRRMRQLHASGELERIFARWNWPYAPLKAILPPKE